MTTLDKPYTLSGLYAEALGPKAEWKGRRIPHCVADLFAWLFSADQEASDVDQYFEDAFALRRIAMTLERWHELECGTTTANGRSVAVCRNPAGKPYLYWLTMTGGCRKFIPDREAGALCRLEKIMARYPKLAASVQSDPRGPALFIVRRADIPAGHTADEYYLRGLAVYK
jgi:hypothetical protein